MATSSEYKILDVKPEDKTEVLQFLRRTFYVDEPLNKAVELCKDGADSVPDLDEYCTNSLDEGMSYKAVDNEGKIVGALIACIGTTGSHETAESLMQKAAQCTNPKFQRILYILAYREKGAKLWEKYPGQPLVEIDVVATDPAWGGRGIMTNLVKETMKKTKERGIKLLRMDTSSFVSAKCAEKFGFTNYYKITYTDLKKDGETLIVPEPPHVYDCVYLKELE